MAEIISLTAEPRSSGTKGTVRALRRAGRVPGIIYGGKEGAELVSFDARELAKHAGSGSFKNQVIEVKVDGKSARVIAREVQLHPVKEAALHVDFFRLEKGARVRVAVPVRFVNDGLSPGIKRGGVLNVVRHEIELVCPADAIPLYITVDLADLDINDSVHISRVTLPPGVRPTIQRDFTVATIAAPTQLIIEVPEAAAVPAEVVEGAEAVPAEGEAPAAEGAAAPAKGGAAPAKGAAPGKPAAPARGGKGETAKS
jgi:large subunit ribosomal protein L25